MIKVIYSAQFNDPSGYGKCARDYLKALDIFITNNPNMLDLRVNIISFDKQRALSESDIQLIEKYRFKTPEEVKSWVDAGDYIFIGHHVPTVILEHENNKPFLSNAKAIVNYTTWEATHLPKTWINIAKQGRINAFIVPCSWNKKVFESDTGVKTYLLSHVVNEPQYNKPEKLGDPNHEVFKLLSVSQWIYRKGFDTLIRAWLMEFNNTPDAVLFLKSYRSNTSEKEQKIIIDEINHLRKNTTMENGKLSNAKIRFIGDLLSREQLDGIYAGSDVFALTSRGEGFSLPYTEAIMHKKPVVCTDLGGHIDYIDYDSNYVVPSHFDSCHSMGAFYDSTMEWIECRILDVRKQLRKAYDDYKTGKLQQKGIDQYNHILKLGLDHKSIGIKFYEIISEINGGIK